MRILAHYRTYLVAFCACLVLLSGCASQESWIERRPPSESIFQSLGWGAEPLTLSPVVVATAESTGLDPTSPGDRVQLASLLVEERSASRAPHLELALSELAAIEADRLAKKQPQAAVGHYADALIHGYYALSAPDHLRSQGTSKHYNNTLASLLHVLRDQGLVRPGAQIKLPESRGACSLSIELHSKRWCQEDFQRFEFAQDFQVTGLRNHYYTSGVGVPLIGIRLHLDRDHPVDKYYPRKLCYPLTAFVRVEQHQMPHAAAGGPATRLVLELHDPMDHSELLVAGQRRTLESDLTTPLAYYLDQPDLHERNLSTTGLFNPGQVEQLQGLYLLEPFDPGRVPVVMVHGLWSSPATWMEMFNDLRSDPRIRSRYQFMFYLYPTGKPFWESGTQMRRDLAEMRRSFDPRNEYLAMDQTVLVGHSMGGLVSRLQSVDSGSNFWKIVSDANFHELDADLETKQELSEMFFFQPDASVRRVVTIGTPHRGSRFANGFTQWIGKKFIELPIRTMAQRQELFRRNPGLFRPHLATEVMTSIDSLSPDSPVLPTLLAAEPAPWVSYHNIVGDVPRSGLSAWFSSRGDGVVTVKSASLDDLQRLESQVIVPESHVALHRHPQSVEEVRRILLRQLTELSPRASFAQEVNPSFALPATNHTLPVPTRTLPVVARTLPVTTQPTSSMPTSMPAQTLPAQTLPAQTLPVAARASGTAAATIRR